MSIDLSQFHEVFYEESYEGLDVMEEGLLEMDIEALDDEVINTIFRAARSIKGGSSTFGFNQVAEFTYVVETLLDEIRGGNRTITQAILDLLLISVDCMRSLIQELQSGGDPDFTKSLDLKAQFEAILNGTLAINKTEKKLSYKEDIDKTKNKAISGKDYYIHFVPRKNILQTGNEPTRMFWQLAEICQNNISITASFDRLPTLTTLNPELCYLSWDIKITKHIDRAKIDEIFEWVIEDSEITITEM